MAASSNDPCVWVVLIADRARCRVLRDALLRYKDWDVAGHVYAVKREGSPSVVVDQAGQIDEIAPGCWFEQMGGRR